MISAKLTCLSVSTTNASYTMALAVSLNVAAAQPHKCPAFCHLVHDNSHLTHRTLSHYLASSSPIPISSPFTSLSLASLPNPLRVSSAASLLTANFHHQHTAFHSPLNQPKPPHMTPIPGNWQRSLLPCHCFCSKSSEASVAPHQDNPPLPTSLSSGAASSSPPSHSFEPTLGATYRLRRLKVKDPSGRHRLTDELADLCQPQPAEVSAASSMPAGSSALELKHLLLATWPNQRAGETLRGFCERNGGIGSDEPSGLICLLSQGGSSQLALEVFEWSKAAGLLLSSRSYTSLIAVLARNGPFQEASSVFASMQEAGMSPTLHSFTAVMQALSRTGDWQRVLRFFERMTSAGFRADVMAFNIAIGACGRASEVDHVMRLWYRMQETNCRPNAATICLLVSTFVRTNNVDHALEAYYHCLCSGLPVSEDVYQGLICCTAKNHRWPLALDLFAFMVADGIRPKRTVLFNALISALAEAGEVEMCLELHQDMICMQVAPDHFTWTSLLSALGRAKRFDQAMEFHQQMMMGPNALAPTLAVCNAALLACQEAAKWQQAVQLLWQMERWGVKADVQSFSTAVKACEMAGQPKAAMRIYERMTQVNCQPNEFTFSALIRAHAYNQDWQQAMQLFESMRQSGNRPNIHVYNSLMFVLVESGQHNMAESIMSLMERQGVSPDSRTKVLLKKLGLF